MPGVVPQQEQQKQYPAAAAEIRAAYPARVLRKAGEQQRVRSGALAGKKIPVHAYIIK